MRGAAAREARGPGPARAGPRPKAAPTRVRLRRGRTWTVAHAAERPARRGPHESPGHFRANAVEFTPPLAPAGRQLIPRQLIHHSANLPAPPITRAPVGPVRCGHSRPARVAGAWSHGPARDAPRIAPAADTARRATYEFQLTISHQYSVARELMDQMSFATSVSRRKSLRALTWNCRKYGCERPCRGDPR